MANHELDDFIMGLSQKPIAMRDASDFVLGLRKMAELAEEGYDDLEDPDDEGEFEADLETVAQTMAHVAGLEIQSSIHYMFYSQMVRGDSSLSDMFDDHAEECIELSQYLLGRLGALVPGGLPMPPLLSPEPASDPVEILNIMIAKEQSSISMLRLLKTQVGEENPMCFTLKEMMAEKQAQLDSLWHQMPADAEKQSSVRAKLAAANRLLMKISEDAEAQQEVESVSEGIAAKEMAAEAQQAIQEAEFHKQRAQEMEQMVAQTSQEAEQANVQAQQSQQQSEMLGQQLQNTQMQADQAQAQAQANLEEATSATQDAATQADAKMRLEMRIQQLRQSLADIVSSDPTEEEGLGFGHQAGPGAPVTVTQKAQQQEEQMMADQEAAAAQEGQGDPPVKQETQKEIEEAQRADQEAQKQQAQAEQALQKESSYKYAGFLSKALEKIKDKAGESVTSAVRSVGSAAGEGISKHAPQAGADIAKGMADNADAIGRGIGSGMGSSLREAGANAWKGTKDKITKPKVIAAGVGLGTLYGGKKVLEHKKDKRNYDQRERLIAAINKRNQG